MTRKFSNILILKKTDVKSIKLFKGLEDYYRITLNKYNFTSTSKMQNTAISLLKNPDQIISYIKNLDLLYELRDAIEMHIKNLQHEKIQNKREDKQL